MINHYRKRQIISAIIAGIIFYLIVFPVYNFFKYDYKAVFDDIDEYKYLFQEPTILDSLFSGIGQIRKTDKNYSYLTKNGYYVEIFEFNDINEYSLNQVEFDYLENFPDDSEWVGRQLNTDLEEVPTVTIKNHLPFNKNLYVDFNKNAPLELIKDEQNCKVYYGSLLKMMLSGENREPLILFNFTDVAKTIIAFYKNENKFLFIIITSDRKPIEKQDLEILDLECS